MFTDLCNDLNYDSEKRPSDWDTALVYMLAKVPGTTLLEKHRPISLMSQAQKLFTRWLTQEITLQCDNVLVEEQTGFRRCRQAPELMHTVRRVLEVQAEWGHHLTVIKVDLKKAFDTVFQSSIVQGLLTTKAHPRYVFALTREMVRSKICPDLWGTRPETSIPLERGSRQGAPESGLMFILAINRSLSHLQEKWRSQGWGIAIGGSLLNSMVFVDDIILFCSCPEDGVQMLRDLERELATVGLGTNPEKTSFLTTMPARARVLPGACVNEQGLTVVGRLFRLSDNSSEEVERRLKLAWGKFYAIREIFAAKNPPEASTHDFELNSLPIFTMEFPELDCHQATVPTFAGFRKTSHEDLDPMPPSFPRTPKGRSFREMGSACQGQARL